VRIPRQVTGITTGPYVNLRNDGPVSVAIGYGTGYTYDTGFWYLPSERHAAVVSYLRLRVWLPVLASSPAPTETAGMAASAGGSSAAVSR
jgi:hypothetical protein